MSHCVELTVVSYFNGRKRRTPRRQEHKEVRQKLSMYNAQVRFFQENLTQLSLIVLDYKSIFFKLLSLFLATLRILETDFCLIFSLF